MKSLSAFANKILGDQELEQYSDMPEGRSQSYLGKQFAAKEAFVKALGTGFKDPVFPRDIQIIRNSAGKPEFYYLLRQNLMLRAWASSNHMLV